MHKDRYIEKKFLEIAKSFRDSGFCGGCTYVSNNLESLISQVQEEAVKEERGAKDKAYGERNNLVAFLSRLYESHLSKHPEEDKTWENEWRWIVCIHSPAGQMTWHIHNSELLKFNHLKQENLNHWDGHTAEEKYERLTHLPETL